MSKHHDKQNIVPPLCIQFLKRPKQKYYTERTNTYGYKTKLAEIDSNTVILLQKQKLYSRAVRQNNIRSHSKKQRNQSCRDLSENKPSTNEDLNVNTLTYANLIKPLSCNRFEVENIDQYSSVHITDKKASAKLKNNLSDKSKQNAIEFTYRTNQPYTRNLEQQLNDQTEDMNFQKLSNEDSNILRFSGLSPAMMINSQVFSETIMPNTQEKQVQLLKKQNATYKRDLAFYRKQNVTFKKDLIDCQKQIQTLKQTNQVLTQQIADQSKLLQNYKMANLQLFDHQTLTIKDSPKNSGKVDSCQQQLFEAKKAIKRLQFKNYMLQKQLIDKEDAHKKVLAHQISVWKQRFIKARNQNLQMKESRVQMLYETYIPEITPSI